MTTIQLERERIAQSKPNLLDQDGHRNIPYVCMNSSFFGQRKYVNSSLEAYAEALGCHMLNDCTTCIFYLLRAYHGIHNHVNQTAYISWI